MKILKYAGRTISLLLFFIHFSCVNEPLEGDFPQDDGVLNIEEGEFRANVGIGDFSTGLAVGVLSNTDLLTITGTIPDTGESIVLTIENRNSIKRRYVKTIFTFFFLNLQYYGRS